MQFCTVDARRRIKRGWDTLVPGEMPGVKLKSTEQLSPPTSVEVTCAVYHYASLASGVLSDGCPTSHSLFLATWSCYDEVAINKNFRASKTLPVFHSLEYGHVY